jgi:cation transport ATPase
MANPRNKTRGVSTERFLTKWIEDTRQELRQQREDLQREARVTFIVVIVAFIIALLLIFMGISFVFINNLPTSIVTAASSIIIGVVCGVAFNFYKEVNNRLFRVSNEMNSLDKNNIAMQYISRIADDKTKDRAIQDLSKSIYVKV